MGHVHWVILRAEGGEVISIKWPTQHPVGGEKCTDLRGFLPSPEQKC